MDFYIKKLKELDKLKYDKPISNYQNYIIKEIDDAKKYIKDIKKIIVKIRKPCKRKYYYRELKDPYHCNYIENVKNISNSNILSANEQYELENNFEYTEAQKFIFLAYENLINNSLEYVKILQNRNKEIGKYINLINKYENSDNIFHVLHEKVEEIDNQKITAEDLFDQINYLLKYQKYSLPYIR